MARSLAGWDDVVGRDDLVGRDDFRRRRVSTPGEEDRFGPMQPNWVRRQNDDLRIRKAASRSLCP